MGVQSDEVHKGVKSTLRVGFGGTGDGPSYSTVQKWVVEFKRGDRSPCTEDEPNLAVWTCHGWNCSGGCPLPCHCWPTCHNAEYRWRQRIRYGSVQFILTDTLHTSKLFTRYSPRMLTPEEKLIRLIIFRDLLSICQKSPDKVCIRIVTRDETWVLHVDPETKLQSKKLCFGFLRKYWDNHDWLSAARSDNHWTTPWHGPSSFGRSYEERTLNEAPVRCAATSGQRACAQIEVTVAAAFKMFSVLLTLLTKHLLSLISFLYSNHTHHMVHHMNKWINVTGDYIVYWTLMREQVWFWIVFF